MSRTTIAITIDEALLKEADARRNQYGFRISRSAFFEGLIKKGLSQGDSSITLHEQPPTHDKPSRKKP